MENKRLEKYSERFDNDESQIGNPETWGRRIKQETLEEAYNKIYKSIDFTEFDFTSFAIGAKWQQKRSYSEEEVEELIYNVCGTVARLQGIVLNGNHINTAYKQHKKK